jgi:molybdenum cofactor synthesis domain-containing protein
VSNRAQILTIGDELLSGEVVDTHASWLDTRLAAWGWRVIRHSSVLDDVEAIAAALRSAAAEAELVLVSGGLGPTQDDVTLEGLARALGVGLVEHAPTVASLHERASRLGRPLTPGSLRQARVPAVGEVLPNAVGTAPAFVAPLLGAQVFLLPGVPRELRYLAEHVVRPRVERARPAVYRRTLKVIGLGESQLEHALSAALGEHAGVRVGFRTLGAENHLKLAASTPECDIASRSAARRRPTCWSSASADMPVQTPAQAEKEKAIELALASVEKQFGKGAIMRLGVDAQVPAVETLHRPLMVDIALGRVASRAAASSRSSGRSRPARPPSRCTSSPRRRSLGRRGRLRRRRARARRHLRPKLGVQDPRPAHLPAGHRRAGARDRRHARALATPSTSWWSTPSPRWCPRPRSKARWATATSASRPA